jgi:putative PIN family toxin of toxin-antitoxin system
MVRVYEDSLDDRRWRRLRRTGTDSAKRLGVRSEEDIERLGQIELLVSSQILLELATVLKTKFEWHDTDVADAIRTIGYCSTLVKPAVVIKEVRDDPDNRVLECAVSGEANFIVSGDYHLLELESHQGIRILKARDLLDILLES